MAGKAQLVLSTLHHRIQCYFYDILVLCLVLEVCPWKELSQNHERDGVSIEWQLSG